MDQIGTRIAVMHARVFANIGFAYSKLIWKEKYMKIMMMSLIALFLISGSSFATQSDEPLLLKQESAGYGPDWAAVSKTCEVWQDKLVLRRYVGGLQTREERALSLEGNVHEVINNAAKSEAKDLGPAPADAPATNYSANQVTPTGARRLLLQGTTPRGRLVENTAPAGQTLVRFLDVVCGE